MRSLRTDLRIDGQTEIRRKRDDFLGLSHKDPLSFAQTIIDIPETNDREFSELVSCAGCLGIFFTKCRETHLIHRLPRVFSLVSK